MQIGQLYIIVYCMYVCTCTYMYECLVASVVSDSDHVDCSLPGSSIHGILQARISEWVAMLIFRGSY